MHHLIYGRHIRPIGLYSTVFFSFFQEKKWFHQNFPDSGKGGGIVLVLSFGLVDSGILLTICLLDPVSKPMKVLPESLKWQPLKLQWNNPESNLSTSFEMFCEKNYLLFSRQVYIYLYWWDYINSSCQIFIFINNPMLTFWNKDCLLLELLLMSYLAFPGNREKPQLSSAFLSPP